MESRELIAIRKATLLNLKHPPGCLDGEQAATFLGVSSDAIRILVAAKLLKPLGNPAPNAPKLFASCDIQTKASDPAWLDRAVKCTSEHWKKRNKGSKAATKSTGREAAEQEEM